MDAKEYFLNIRKMGFKLKMVEDDVKELVNLSERAGAMDYSIERVQTGEAIKEPAFVKVLDRIEKRRDAYRELFLEYEEATTNATRQLNMLEHSVGASIIREKYFKGKTLEKISREMNYSLPNVKYHYGNAMREFTRRELWNQ